MGKRNTPGLQLRKGVWHIDKVVRGQRLCESTSTGDREEAETILAKRVKEIRDAKLHGISRKRKFREAATKFINDNLEKPSIKTDAIHLKALDPFIGNLNLDEIDDDSLAEFRKAMKYVVTVRREDGNEVITRRLRKNKSINNALGVVIKILNLASRKWRDELRKPWLNSVPFIELLKTNDSRTAYPVDWVEQRFLMAELPSYLERMALFKINVGSREQEVCKLEWEWEIPIPELNTSLFVVPSDFGGRDGASGVKNGEDRVLILNRVAMAVVDSQRGLHSKYVFPYEGKALHRMNNSAWGSATKRAADKMEKETGKPAPLGFRNLRVHDLKHSFGRRLRSVGVSPETRKVLLGHKNGDITTHYSAAEIKELIDAANMVCELGTSFPTLTLIKSSKLVSHAKVTHEVKMG